MNPSDRIIGLDDPILITGAAGFMGTRVVENLAVRGFRDLRCLVRPSGDLTNLDRLRQRLNGSSRLQIVKGNLLSRGDCLTATEGVTVIYHLAAGRGEKLFADAFLNSVVTTRNLLEAAGRQTTLKRFVSISSFAVYSNRQKPHGRVLEESCPAEAQPACRGSAYSFAKAKQDEIVLELAQELSIPYVIVRPGVVYGPGNEGIHGRIGVGTFGVFLHLGGSNRVPFTYVDNCAEAIVLAGLKPGIDGEVFNVVDDDLPTSRQFLRLYKRHVRRFKSIYLPHALSYLLCYLWERYSDWSEGQLPPAFNRSTWHAVWKKTTYTNQKLKSRLGWKPLVSTEEGLKRLFAACRQKGIHA